MKPMKLASIGCMLVILAICCQHVSAQSYKDYRRLQHGDAKEDNLLAAIAKNPGEQTGYVKLANYYSDKGKYDLAAGYFNKAIDIDPHKISVYGSYSDMYVKARRVDNAIVIMEKARSVSPSDYDVIITLASLYSIGKYYDKVVDLYKNGIEVNREKRPNLRVKLAEFYENNEKYADAANEYELIAVENPELAHFKEKANDVRKKEVSGKNAHPIPPVIKGASKNKKLPEDFDEYVPKMFRVEKNEIGKKGESIYELVNPRLKTAFLLFRAYDSGIEADMNLNSKCAENTLLKIRAHDFEKEVPDIYSRFGYSIGKNALGDYVISIRRRDTKRPSLVLYPEELEPEMHTFIVKCMLENGCSIVDLMNCKSQYDSSPLSDVVSYYRDTYQVDAFFIFYYQLYSSYIGKDPLNNVKGQEYGLMCDYKIVLIDSRDMSILFQDTDSIRVFVMSGGKSAFFGGSGPLAAKVEWVGKKGGSGGIIDRAWLKDRFLETFKRYKTTYVENIRSKKEAPFSYSFAARLKYNFDSLFEQ